MYTIGTENGICANTAGVWQLVGYLIMVFKIVIPVILIIIGIITLGKAVISTDENESKKGFSLLIKKFIIAVVIFFLPSVISALFGSVEEFDNYRSDYNVCQKCIVSPNGEYCNNMVIASSVDFSAY